MEIQVSSSSSLVLNSSSADFSEKDCVRYKRKTLKAVLDQCQRALESLASSDAFIDYDDHSKAAAITMEQDGGEPSRQSSIDLSADREIHEVCFDCFLYPILFF